MNEHNFHSDPQLASVIDQYLSDELSQAEMHQLEKEMLSDPFLADAVEGLALISNSTKRDNIIKGIRNQLNAKLHQGREFDFKPYRYAAAVLLILILSTVLFWQGDYFKGTANKTLSEVKKEVATDEPNEQKNLQETELNNLDESQELNAEVEKDVEAKDKAESNEVPSKTFQPKELNTPQAELATRSKSQSIAQRKLEKPIDQLEEEIEDIEKRNQNLTKKQKIENLNNLSVGEQELADEETEFSDDEADIISEERKTDFVVTEEVSEPKRGDTSFVRQGISGRIAGIQVKKEKKKKEARNSRAFSAIVNPRAISGVITDENKEPLPGASVIIKGSSEGAVSDINGNFSLNLSQEEGVLQVAYIGFKTEEISLESGVDELKIELNPDNVSLSEVVVTAYGESSNEDKQQVIVYARPKGGMKNFRQHVAKNLMIPEAAKANNINGTVKLSFDVNINGAISDILVKKSLGFGCDEEAIRLLKTGPNWQSKTINGSPVSSEQTVKIKFKSK